MDGPSEGFSTYLSTTYFTSVASQKTEQANDTETTLMMMILMVIAMMMAMMAMRITLMKSAVELKAKTEKADDMMLMVVVPNN